MNIAKMYQKRPSEILGITNDYLAYCFDDVCCIIQNELMREKPNITFIEDTKEGNQNNPGLNLLLS